MRFLLKAFLISILFLSCDKSETCNDFKEDCSTIRCFAFWSYFDFKLVDKVTGADLVSGSNPRYNLTDIKLYFDAAKTAVIPYTFDDTKKSFHVMTAREEMYLEIKGANVYKLLVEFRSTSCCSVIVKTLTIDGQAICTCCKEVIEIPVS